MKKLLLIALLLFGPLYASANYSIEFLDETYCNAIVNGPNKCLHIYGNSTDLYGAIFDRTTDGGQVGRPGVFVSRPIDYRFNFTYTGPNTSTLTGNTVASGCFFFNRCQSMEVFDVEYMSFATLGQCNGLTRTECLATGATRIGCFSYEGGAAGDWTIQTCTPYVPAPIIIPDNYSISLNTPWIGPTPESDGAYQELTTPYLAGPNITDFRAKHVRLYGVRPLVGATGGALYLYLDVAPNTCIFRANVPAYNSLTTGWIPYIVFDFVSGNPEDVVDCGTNNSNYFYLYGWDRSQFESYEWGEGSVNNVVKYLWCSDDMCDMNTLLDDANNGYISLMGNAVGTDVAFVGENFIKLIIGSAFSVLLALRYWVVSIIILSAVVFFSYRAFRFFRH